MLWNIIRIFVVRVYTKLKYIRWIQVKMFESVTVGMDKEYQST